LYINLHLYNRKTKAISAILENLKIAKDPKDKRNRDKPISKTSSHPLSSSRSSRTSRLLALKTTNQKI